MNRLSIMLPLVAISSAAVAQTPYPRPTPYPQQQWNTQPSPSWQRDQERLRNMTLPPTSSWSYDEKAKLPEWARQKLESDERQRLSDWVADGVSIP